MATELRGLRHAPDRLLHQSRRRAALRDIALAPSPRYVYFICHGNICRSPFAAAAFVRAVGSSAAPIRVTSAGFIGPNRASPPEALAAAERLGHDLTAHRSELISADEVRAADLIVVMSADQAADIRVRFPSIVRGLLVLGDLDPLPIRTRTIRDPWGCEADVFDASYARIERCVGALARAIESHGQLSQA